MVLQTCTLPAFSCKSCTYCSNTTK